MSEETEESEPSDIATEEADRPRPPRQKKLVGGLTSPMDIASDSLNEFIKLIGPMALLGVGQLLAAMVAMAILVPLAMGCFVGFAVVGGVAGAGLGAGGDDAAAAGAAISMLMGLVGYLGMFIIIIFGAAVVLAPIHGSVVRAIDDQIHGVRDATLGSAFDTATKQLGLDVGATLGMQLAFVLSLVVPLVGPLIAGFFLGWWPLAAQLDGDGIGAAAKKSVDHTRAYMSWHLPYFGLAFVYALVGGNIPVIGPMAALYYQVKAYRVAFPREDAELVA